MGRLFGSEGAKHFEGAGSLAQKMVQSGATPEEINAALTHYLKGQVPDGQDPATGWSQYGKYRNEKGDWNWPPNNGAISGSVSQTTIPKGTILDRFGSEKGYFVSPSGVPYSERSLAPGTAAYPPVKYEVIKPIPAEKGTIAPAFGEPGGGVQYKLNDTIEELIKNKYIKKVEQ
ncbi:MULTISPECIES: TNT domain-containing protein [Photorhabdus]|uniref:TNT domain-containing protein n=2 Tax=Photorhabdus asymbiotica TaxID=291112 RepID=B6VNL0_PHOAA|nr:TNT domain-containing protein [Photorhabdus asymbiotica]RKS59280.1 uncharacterized protein DUF4237 [Photorhabdus asymbiotica]CAQ85406.1 conserved hypothetical protein [Photorhabdus asymbiotica]CAR67740.1 Hypothetical protein PA-RVA20-21-0133 [Photorhabdus asymbiotica subsp. asymbiotica ATCC 43949]